MKQDRTDSNVRKIVWLVTTLFVLLGAMLPNASGIARVSLSTQPSATVNSPPVVLQEGTAGNSTIYTNRTSAKTSIPTTEGWWSTSYKYRRRISILNDAMSPVSSAYSVCLAIDTASLVSGGKMLSNGNDLRIVYRNGTSWTEIDRDVVDMNTSATKIWFRTQTQINASSADNHNYYVYFSNPSASSPPANKSNVYLWFDDFSTNTTASYQIGRHANDWHGLPDYAYAPYWDSISSAVYFDTGDDYVGGWMPSSINETDVYAEMRMWITGSYQSNTTNGILLRWQDNGTFYGGHVSGDSYTSQCLVRNGRTIYVAYNSPNEYHPWNQWFTFAVAVHGSSLKLWVDGASKVNGTDTQIAASGKVSFLVSQAIGWMDDFKMRRYVNPEPSTTTGPEEGSIQDYVDNCTSNVDSSADKGTHSNFTAQQYSPDSICDTLTEANTSKTLGNWGITSSTFTATSTHTTYRYMGGASPNIDNMTATKLRIRYSGTGTAAIALYTGGTLTDPTGATKRTEAYNVAVSAGWNTIDVPDYSWPKNTATWVGWCHGGASVYYSTSASDAGDFQMPRGRYEQTAPADADQTSPMPTNPSSGAFINNWYAVYVEYEAPNYELDLEVQWTGMDHNQPNEELAIHANKGNTNSLDATGGYMLVGSGTPNWGSVAGTISFWIKWDTVANRPWGQHENMETRISGTNLVVDWGAATTITSRTNFVSGRWYFIAITWNENTDSLYLYVGDQDTSPAEDTYLSGWTLTVSTVGVTQNNLMASKGGVNPTDGRGDDLRYWNTDRTLSQIQGDYNTELGGSEANLRSYFKLNGSFDDLGPNNNDGSGSGSYAFSSDVPFDENIQVDIWNGSSWQNLFANLTNGWNNVSVSSWLVSSPFTIRFKGDVESSDVVMDTCEIDAALLHMWSPVQDWNYALRIAEAGGSAWKVRLKAYGQSNMGRLENCSIFIYNGANSTQITILDGAYSQQTGSWYDLAASGTEYIGLHIETSTSGTSHIYALLEILVPDKTTYIQYVVTFEIM